MAELNPFAAFSRGQELGMARRAEERLEADRARAATTRNRLADLLSGGMPSTPEAKRAVVSDIARSDPEMALDWAKHFEKSAPDMLARRKTEAPFYVSELQGVTDQGGYDRARARLGALGVDVSDMPDVYDPKQVNMALQASRYLAEGPSVPTEGPYRGDAQWAQDRNVLLTASPDDPRYAASYAAMASPREIWDAASGQMIRITPDMSPYAPPTGRAGAMRAAAPAKPAEPMGVAGQPAPKVKDVTPKPAGMTVTRIGEKPLTPGQKARDTEFGKEYVKWTGGGQADAEKNITQLEEQIERLESGENLTGPVIGNVPRVIGQFTTPGSIDVREQVEEVVQRNLREILGAQFTEREGERLISRAYNPSLEEPINARRLRRLAQQMKNAANAKNAMAEHFDQFGTLQGYEGPRMLTMQQMGDIIEAEEAELDQETIAAPVEEPTAAGLPQPKTKAERDALPSGTDYLDPNGVRRTRP